MSENILELRKEIDSTDEQIVALLKKRMDVSCRIAEYKKENGMKVFDPRRERELLLRVSELAGEEHESEARVLFSLLMELSRSRQNRITLPQSRYEEILKTAVKDTQPLFPERASVACQGTEGAFAQLACEKLFPLPDIMYCNSFESVFAAVDKGLCRYGVIPLENSTAGSVNHVYDLMIKNHFYIVRSTRLQVNHNLLVKPGTKLSDVKEVISHEQALNQCSRFLSQLKGVKLTACANTAVAAQMLAESDRSDLAAVSSAGCASLYGLETLEQNVQNGFGNFTRFICISKKPEIYPGADRTSLMLVLPHRPGALYRVMARFYAHNINVIKLESRPIPERDFEFMFYFDINASVYSPALTQLICELESDLEQFTYLGSYSEIV